MVRRALRIRRVGHLGTLDPFAAGLLVILVGRATRLAPFAGAWTKTYEGVLRLGVTTDTDDRTGQVTATGDAVQVTAAAVEAVLARFRGTYEQRPPAYSAVKVAGERAYRRARRGETVEPPARPVHVHDLELVEFRPPDVRFRATVSAGTYVRSLARDIGVALGCGAHLVELNRTAVGPYALADAVAPERVTAADLRDSTLLVGGLARRALTAPEREAVVHGRPILAESGVRGPDSGPLTAGPVALFAGAELVAVAEPEGELLKPRVVVTEP